MSTLKCPIRKKESKRIKEERRLGGSKDYARGYKDAMGRCQKEMKRRGC